MRFWDASAIAPLLMTEISTKHLQTLAAKDPAMLVWWATEVECASAIARLEREGALDEPVVTKAFERLKQLAGGWHEVDPSDAVREAAIRFLRVHPLRAADVLQLAASLRALLPQGKLVLAGFSFGAFVARRSRSCGARSSRPSRRRCRDLPLPGTASTATQPPARQSAPAARPQLRCRSIAGPTGCASCWLRFRASR
jgi:hypothetical protein